MIISVITLLSAMSLTSCKEGVKPEVVYNMNITGDTDGAVDVVFPNGSLALDGAAKVAFVFSNDTTQTIYSYLNDGNKLYTEKDIINSNNPEQIQALLRVNEYVDNNFGVTATEAVGHYDVYVKGYVKETLTGFVIAVNRRWTNKE